MINPIHLVNYPRHHLEPSLIDWFNSVNAPSRRDYRSPLALPFNAFLDITSTKFRFLHTNDRELTEHVLKGFVGFIYTELNISISLKYHLTSQVKRLPRTNLQLGISNTKVTDDARLAINYYQMEFNVDNKTRCFYQGWFVESKQRDSLFLNLTTIYLTYSEELISHIHGSVKRCAIKEATETLKTILKAINLIIAKLTVVASDDTTFFDVMSSKNIHKTISCIYKLCLNDAVQSGNCLKVFHQKWRSGVRVFKEVFVEGGIVGRPRLELLAPAFKTTGKQVTARTKERSDNNGNVFNHKLVAPIPLSYADSKAKKQIFESIRLDIEHVTVNCRELWREGQKKLNNFRALAKKGKVRPEESLTGFPVPVEMKSPENFCASFMHYGFRYPKPDYDNWLHMGKVTDLTHLISLPTITLTQAFCYLLIEIHPCITTSWLVRWDLYDAKGNFYGYRESSGAWIAVSKKERKGKSLAQQEVILTAESKKLIDEYLELTKQLREQLKKESNKMFRKMIISADGIQCKAKTINPKCKLTDQLKSLLVEPSVYRTAKQATCIANHVTYARMRGAVGVRVYFETNSVHAMAEALGHEKYVPALINHYLPKPLWSYFTNRWIRQFQNAIVYEAMKDSPYLFDAIELQPNELEEFLVNHRLGNLPRHIRTGKEKAKDLTIDELCAIDDGVILVSTSLLQLFMSLITIVDNAPEGATLKEFAREWYETAKFVISHIAKSLENRRGNYVGSAEKISNEIRDMYLTAIKNPLDPELIRGNILCP
ncbi:hypothetical protein [Vibrio sp. YYF0003]|uniref:hypothetical protein n=1 Tax=Vibrio sp. YYF0003 TaxID=3116646 RepID=UPI002E99C1F4|nr:hypothetical protein [Vibrio sp. YYF0003]